MSATLAVCPEISITIPPGGWEIIARDGSKPARLLAKEPLLICGLRMHLEAWRVVRGKREVEAGEMSSLADYAQAGAQLHPYDDESFGLLWKVFSGGDGDFTTTRITGYSGNWILLATPFVN